MPATAGSLVSASVPPEADQRPSAGRIASSCRRPRRGRRAAPGWRSSSHPGGGRARGRPTAWCLALAAAIAAAAIAAGRLVVRRSRQPTVVAPDGAARPPCGRPAGRRDSGARGPPMQAAGGRRSWCWQAGRRPAGGWRSGRCPARNRGQRIDGAGGARRGRRQPVAGRRQRRFVGQRLRSDHQGPVGPPGAEAGMHLQPQRPGAAAGRPPRPAAGTATRRLLWRTGRPRRTAATPGVR